MDKMENVTAHQNKLNAMGDRDSNSSEEPDLQKSSEKDQSE